MRSQKFDDVFDYAFNFELYNDSKNEVARNKLDKLFSDINPSDFSEEELKNSFYWMVWCEMNIEYFEDIELSKKVFDFSAEFGSKRTSIFVQRALNSGWQNDLVVDGNIGEREIELINDIDDSWILKNIVSHYAASFCEIFADKNNISFLMQWVFR